MSAPKAFLGRGWRFPVDPVGNRLRYSEMEEKIQQSILLILGTRPGERVMRPDFGCRVHEMVFAPAGSSLTRSLVAEHVTQALTTWEPRIDVLSVSVHDTATTGGRLLVDIEYRVRAVNTTFNLVYPFYLREGSDERAAS